MPTNKATVVNKDITVLASTQNQQQQGRQGAAAGAGAVLGAAPRATRIPRPALGGHLRVPAFRRERQRDDLRDVDPLRRACSRRTWTTTSSSWRSTSRRRRRPSPAPPRRCSSSCRPVSWMPGGGVNNISNQVMVQQQQQQQQQQGQVSRELEGALHGPPGGARRVQEDRRGDGQPGGAPPPPLPRAVAEAIAEAAAAAVDSKALRLAASRTARCGCLRRQRQCPVGQVWADARQGAAAPAALLPLSDRFLARRRPCSGTTRRSLASSRATRAAAA